MTEERTERPQTPTEQFSEAIPVDDSDLIIPKRLSLPKAKALLKTLSEAARFARAVARDESCQRREQQRRMQQTIEDRQADIAKRADEIAKLQKLIYQVHLMTDE